jgi:hypothetical protein
MTPSLQNKIKVVSQVYLNYLHYREAFTALSRDLSSQSQVMENQRAIFWLVYLEIKKQPELHHNAVTTRHPSRCMVKYLFQNYLLDFPSGNVDATIKAIFGNNVDISEEELMNYGYAINRVLEIILEYRYPENNLF